MAIMEAQACGTPVIAFEAGGTPEAVFPKTPCQLIPNGDFDGLHAALETSVKMGRVSDLTRTELSRWVIDRHHAAHIVRRQVEIYNA